MDGAKSWDRWFTPLLDLIKRRPEIKGTAYINWEWKEWSDRLGFSWHDWGANANDRRHIHASATGSKLSGIALGSACTSAPTMEFKSMVTRARLA